DDGRSIDNAGGASRKPPLQTGQLFPRGPQCEAAPLRDTAARQRQRNGAAQWQPRQTDRQPAHGARRPPHALCQGGIPGARRRGPGRLRQPRVRPEQIRAARFSQERRRLRGHFVDRRRHGTEGRRQDQLPPDLRGCQGRAVGVLVDARARLHRLRPLRKGEDQRRPGDHARRLGGIDQAHGCAAKRLLIFDL
ncbi:hypothetical protein PFISCL1PPCAC_23121, partial [Pristionchus fissidentatus]